MASTVADSLRSLRGKDFSVGFSPQTAKGAINASPVFVPYRRTDGVPIKAVTYTEDPTVYTGFQGLEQLQESRELTAELSSSVSKQSTDLMIQALHGTEQLLTVTATDIAATATGFTSVAEEFGIYSVGDMFWVGGFADAENNTNYIVATVTAAEITTTIAPAVIDSAGASITLLTRKTWNANTPTWNTLQLATVDTSQADDTAYSTYYDAVLNSFSLEIGATGIVTSTASFVMESEVDGYLAIAGQTYSAAPTDRSITSTKSTTNPSVKAFYVDGVNMTCSIEAFSLEVNNNYEKKDVAGCNALYFRGQPTYSGSFTALTFIDDSRRWVEYSELGTRIEVGVLVRHGINDETYHVVRQAVATEATQPNDNNSTSSTEVTFVGEKDDDAAVTVATYRNWA